MIFPDEIWTLIKDFMPTWKENHSRKLKQSLKKNYLTKEIRHKKGIWKSRAYVGIEANYPLNLIRESYSLKNKIYVTSFLVPWSSYSEDRVSNFYDTKECQWFSTRLKFGNLDL